MLVKVTKIDYFVQEDTYHIDHGMGEDAFMANQMLYIRSKILGCMVLFSTYSQRKSYLPITTEHRLVICMQGATVCGGPTVLYNRWEPNQSYKVSF